MIESSLHTAALPGTGLIHFWGVCVCVCVCRSQGEVRIGPLTVSPDSSTNRASLRGDLIRAGGCTSGRVHNKWPTVPRAPVAYEIKRTFITLSVIPLCPRSPFLSQSASSGGRRGSHHYLWHSQSKTCSSANSHTEVLCPAVFFSTHGQRSVSQRRGCLNDRARPCGQSNFLLTRFHSHNAMLAIARTARWVSKAAFNTAVTHGGSKVRSVEEDFKLLQKLDDKLCISRPD